MSTHPRLSVLAGGGHGPPRAQDQRPLPLTPQKGFKIEVRARDDPWCIFTNWCVHQANGRSFLVYSNGRRERLPNAAWRLWLAARLAEGEIVVASWGEPAGPPPRPQLVWSQQE